MHAVLGECLEAVSSELSFIALENAFELFGEPPRAQGGAALCARRCFLWAWFAATEQRCGWAPRSGMDLMIDEEWNVWLLEANAEPDFAQTGAPADQPAVLYPRRRSPCLQALAVYHACRCHAGPPAACTVFLRTGDRLQQVVEGVVEGTLRLSLDRWFPAGAVAGTSGLPEGFAKVFSRLDPRAQRATIAFK